MSLKDELLLLQDLFGEAVYRVDDSGKLVKVAEEPDEAPPKKPVQKSWFGVSPGKSGSSKPSKQPYGPTGLGPEGTSGSEKPAYKKPEKWISAGGVVLGGEDDLDHVYIRKPANNYGPWAFAKGKIDEGETKEQAALREVEEEIGIVAKIIPGGYLGLAEGSMSHTHYYMMYAVRNMNRHDKETEKVMLASWTEAVHKFAKGGNNRDIKILTKAMDFVEKMKRANIKR
jgi:8-oxo-dGTP pyrophosphatase MutT (NUDIX family)